MAIVNKPNTFSGNTTISSSEVNSNFDTLYNEFNGSISAANLADDAVTSAKLADNAVVTANITDASVTNAKLASQAWQSWTPTWTNVTIGNATVVGKYAQIGKVVTCTLSFIYGSSTSISGVMQFSLPVTAATRYTGTGVGAPYIGTAYIEDSAITGYAGTIQANNTTRAQLVITGTGGTYGVTAGATGTQPFTWATGDFFTGTFTYEAA